MTQPHYPDALAPLLAYSEEIGRDLSLVQGAGGNTSFKSGDELWVKASGKWLADARTEDIMVPMRISAVKAVLDRRGATDKDFGGCVDRGLSDTGLRPSVEAPIHAVLDFAYVVHTHDIETIGMAVRHGSAALFETALAGLRWKYIPYVKPGIPLGKSLIEVAAAGDEVFILENHGLVVAGNSIDAIRERTADVRARIAAVRGALRPEPGSAAVPEAIDLSDTGYRYATDPRVHDAARDPASAAFLSGGAAVPDFVVFLGASLPVLDPCAPDLRDRLSALRTAPNPQNGAVILSGHGVVVRDDAYQAAEDMLLFTCDLVRRLPETPDIRYLSDDQVAELLNWDSEKYRQSLNTAPPPDTAKVSPSRPSPA